MPISNVGPKPVTVPSTPAAKSATALQSHVAFFAQPDGTITIDSTKKALESLGYNAVVSTVLATAILGGLSAKEHAGSTIAAVKDKLNMNVENIKQAKHPGSTGVFSADGTLNEARLNERFNKFDANKDGNLSASEVATMQQEDLKGLSVGDKIFGLIATKGEFGVLENVLKMNGRPLDKNGDVLISKDDLTSFYKGDLFPKLAQARAQAPSAAAAAPKGWKP